MDPAEVAEYLQVPLANLYQWRYRGVGPRSIKVGRHLRWRRSDIDRWLSDRSTSPLP